MDNVRQYDQLRSTEITDEDGLTYSALATAVNRRAPLVALSLAIVVLFQGYTKVANAPAWVAPTAKVKAKAQLAQGKVSATSNRSAYAVR